MDNFIIYSLSIFIAVLVIFIVKYYFSSSKNKEISNENEETQNTKNNDNNKTNQQKNIKKQKINQNKNKNKKKQTEQHKRYLCTLKNHTNEVVHVEFSPCGNYLATASEDRTLLLYKIKTLLDPSHPYKKVNISGDVPGRFCISIDGKYIIITMQMTNQIYVYGISLTKGGSLLKQIKAIDHHKQPVNAIDFSSNCKYIMSCSSTDTKVNLWDLKGNVIFSLITNQISNNMAKFTPNGRFLGIATMSTELKLWEITEEKGEFKSLEKAISGSSANGHKKTLTCLDFTSDSLKMVTGSKDGKWKLWNIDVDYKRDEDATCILTASEPNLNPIQYLKISSNNKYLATVSDNTLIIIWNLTNGKIIDQIPNAHERKITSLSWSRNSDLLASSSEDTRVNIWKI